MFPPEYDRQNVMDFDVAHALPEVHNNNTSSNSATLMRLQSFFSLYVPHYLAKYETASRQL